jgi:hypothetical protein
MDEMGTFFGSTGENKKYINIFLWKATQKKLWTPKPKKGD